MGFKEAHRKIENEILSKIEKLGERDIRDVARRLIDGLQSFVNQATSEAEANQDSTMKLYYKGQAEAYSGALQFAKSFLSDLVDQGEENG